VNKLAIIGAGGHGKVVADIAIETKRWNEIVFFDDVYPKKVSVECWPILGCVNDLILKMSEYQIIVAIGNNATRVKIQLELENLGGRLTTLIHPKAIISSFSKIEPGCVVMAGAVVNAFSEISKSSIINTNSVVEHDCLLATGVHISPNASLAGGVKVGSLSWVGIGTCVRELIEIGDNIIIGAGSVVVKNILTPGVYVGNPLGKIQ